ncbi:hypothetical protein TruAng_011960 [Truncatella angustata]|nr:hypothetical protein TruAng_011960 [Truncatella angustata]
MSEASQRAKRITQIGHLEPLEIGSQQQAAQFGVSQFGLKPNIKNNNGKRIGEEYDIRHNKLRRWNLIKNNGHPNNRPTKLVNPVQAFLKKNEAPSVYYALSPVQLELGGMQQVAPIESYITEDDCIVVYEGMSISLDMLIRSLAYPSDEELGVILGQILDALSYVEKNGFQLASLTPQMVLLSSDGEVKITILSV